MINVQFNFGALKIHHHERELFHSDTFRMCKYGLKNGAAPSRNTCQMINLITTGQHRHRAPRRQRWTGAFRSWNTANATSWRYQNNTKHLVLDSSPLPLLLQAPSPLPNSYMVLQPSSFPSPPVNIQAVEADWAERFLARAQLEQIRPPGHIYCSTPAPANKACPVQLSSKC